MACTAQATVPRRTRKDSNQAATEGKRYVLKSELSEKLYKALDKAQQQNGKLVEKMTAESAGGAVPRLPLSAPPVTLVVHETTGDGSSERAQSVSCTFQAKTNAPGSVDSYDCTLSGWDGVGEQDASVAKGFFREPGLKLFEVFATAQGFGFVQDHTVFRGSFTEESKFPQWESITCTRDGDGAGFAAASAGCTYAQGAPEGEACGVGVGVGVGFTDLRVDCRSSLTCAFAAGKGKDQKGTCVAKGEDEGEEG
jgi:hypothetical protein